MPTVDGSSSLASKRSHGRATTSGDSLLDVRGLSVAFERSAGLLVVVDDVSLSVPRGKTVALVGESGCGKTLTALALLRLIAPPGRIVDGEVHLHAGSGERVELLSLPDRRMRRIRGNRIAMIFQEPATALNPVYTIGEQIVEAIQLHRRVPTKQARTLCVELLRRVALPGPQHLADEYPHRLSGGMQQRAMIAMALSCGPDLLIADEPTTALDATTQREILELLQSLQETEGMSVLLITHDLGVVGDVADEIYVMYAGRIVEHGSAADVLGHPLHPYTRGLIECTPRLGRSERRLPGIPGMVPGPADWPSGCRFHPRCALTDSLARDADHRAEIIELKTGRMALERCANGAVHELALREVAPAHWSACPEQPRARSTEPLQQGL